MLFVLEQRYLLKQSHIKLRLDFLLWKPSKIVTVRSEPFHLWVLEYSDRHHHSLGFSCLWQPGLVYIQSVFICLFSLINIPPGKLTRRFGVWGRRDGGFPSVWPVVASAALAVDSFSGCVGWTSCHHHSVCVLAAKWGFQSSRTPSGPIAWQTLNFLSDAQIMAGCLSCPCALTLTSGHHDQLQRTTRVCNFYPELWGFPSWELKAPMQNEGLELFQSFDAWRQVVCY